MPKRGRPRTQGGSSGPAHISLDAAVELLAEQARQTPDGTISTEAWERLAELAGVHPNTLRDRVKAAVAEPAADIPLPPLPLSPGIEKRGTPYLLPRLLAHEEWLEKAPPDNPERQRVVEDDQRLRRLMAARLRRTDWLTMSYERMRQLLDLKRS